MTELKKSLNEKIHELAEELDNCEVVGNERIYPYFTMNSERLKLGHVVYRVEYDKTSYHEHVLTIYHIQEIHGLSTLGMLAEYVRSRFEEKPASIYVGLNKDRDEIWQEVYPFKIEFVWHEYIEKEKEDDSTEDNT